jgi:hypothetical protein
MRGSPAEAYGDVKNGYRKIGNAKIQKIGNTKKSARSKIGGGHADPAE